MAVCQIDEISVSCTGGCGLICTSTHCWGWCEPTAAVIRTGGEATLARSDVVRVCTTGLSREAFVEALRRILDTDLVESRERVDEEDEEADLSGFSGTVDELLEHLGLSAGSAAY